LNRLISLDAFRGATIACMILVNNPGSWQHTYAQLEHSEWNGWTFTDLVFPFFLWIAGVSMTLSFAKRAEAGANRRKLLFHAIRRAVTIFAIALLMNGFPTFQYHALRIPGVLQRIAICYLIASVIYLFCSLRGRILWLLAVLIFYWMLMTLYPVPGFGPGVLTKEGNLARYIDGLVLTGHMWPQTKTWDPEGIVGTLPAIATALFGTLAGTLLRTRKPPAEKTAWLFVAACGLLFAGLIMNIWMPINKSIWTSTFAVFMAGMATLVFACFYWIVDVQHRRRWAEPFAIYGMNAIAAYILSGMLERLLELHDSGAWLFQNIFAPIASPKNASLLYAIANVLTVYAISWFLYRRRWFPRL
jgi:predicted acyltransferase